MSNEDYTNSGPTNDVEFSDVPNPALAGTAAEELNAKRTVYAISFDKGLKWITKQISLNIPSNVGKETEAWLAQSIDGGKHYHVYRKFAIHGQFVPDGSPTPTPTPTPNPTPTPTPTPPPPSPPPPPPLIPIKGIIEVVNNSSTVTDSVVKSWCDAVKIQCDRDVWPFWGSSVEFNLVPAGQAPRAGLWHCGIFNTTDEPGVLGWHDVGPDGEPIMKIFTGEAAKYHLDPATTLSHEVLETIGDTDANTTITVINAETGKPRTYFLENCDPTENFTYQINGVNVSDFVTRNWFQMANLANAKFDFLGLCTKPFQIIEGGYMYVKDDGGDWHEINASKRVESDYRALEVEGRKFIMGRSMPNSVKFHDQAGIHQRRYRRRKSRTDWIMSDYKTRPYE